MSDSSSRGRGGSARRRLEACRAACLRNPRVAPRPASAFEYKVVDRNPARDAVFMILFGLSIVAFCVFANFAMKEDAERLSLLAGTAPFILAGLGLIVGGIASARGMTSLSISGDEVKWEKRGLFSRRSFSEPLSAFLCVFPVTRVVSRPQHRMGITSYAYLVHGEDPGKSVGILIRSQGELGVFLDHGGERKPMEELARALELPLATETSAGIVVRNVEELDQPLGERLGRTVPAAPSGPSLDFPSRRYRITRTGGGWRAERGYPGYILPCVLFASASAAFVAFAPEMAARGVDPEGLGPLALVFGAFACFMFAFSLTRARLELSPDALEASYRVAGILVLDQRMALSEIEEVTEGQEARSKSRSLMIASDRTTIAWAQRGSDEEIAWFRDEILRAIGRTK